jgi:UDP-N-acetylmuramoyl-tripeptide--D-alanyl-D-alanine ligase
MGISRIVREQLGPHHRFFLCEMGAYGPGSIERLCRLAPPDLAIITAIGPAHYERFKSLEAVARTKFELAQYALDRGGKLVVTSDVLKFPYPQSFYQTHRDRIVVVGFDPSCELRVGAIDQTAQGISVDVVWADTKYILRAGLYGSHHALNLAVAFAAACVLGMAPRDVVVAMSSVPQVSHRLEVKRQANGHVLIDDAYNSNPVGFVNGLQLLDVFRKGSGRRILVTPGMVELGTVHDEEHRKIGDCAGSHVDVLLAVVPQRIDPLVRAYRQANPQGLVISCSAFADAQGWLEANVRPEDVVLLENDLPDLYEKELSL